MQQQQQPPTLNSAPQFPSSTITTEQIQKVISSIELISLQYLHLSLTAVNGFILCLHFITPLLNLLLITLCNLQISIAFSYVGFRLFQIIEYVGLLCLMQFLDENRNLILAIMENQNLGKLQECAQ